ncbi:NADP-dependent 3-hydroxy acid dehydrogenase YdfG [Bacillus pakistanensis]|uniref:NADP-dependent 3-hydroxy acid dehydrogenase YdfG n=1 Tax=Rossellomorea pakistanensis TaxID=992288 RepID=A0ABS2NES1_9BACI|nr:SDR family oxidoreductase [Bacillus pakistanensis]MBM7586349.1 NADP-dependent 3-hydroxy acid dehydrogenase YdfG [Bacillus pakistanensis]
MLNKQVAIVTGASRGIGKEIAQQLLEEEVKLTIVGSSDGIKETGQQLRDLGFQDVLAIQADISKESDVIRVVEETIAAYGKIDLLVNNAGIGFFKSTEEVTEEEWSRIFEVNVQGVFLCSKAVLPHMKKQKFGTIITISSDVARYTISNASAYVATKYAVQGFCGSLAQEVREHGIRVGTVNPGMVDTYFANSTQGIPEKEDWLKVTDIASAVVYMASAPKHMMIDEMILHPFAQDYPIA